MKELRRFLLLFAVLPMSGCTFFFDVQESVQPDPAPDATQQRAIFAEVGKITRSMKQAGPSEVSDVGPNEARSGPENWTVCSRTILSGEPRYFTFFVRGEKVVSWRPAVINDRCESRRFSSRVGDG